MTSIWRCDPCGRPLRIKGSKRNTDIYCPSCQMTMTALITISGSHRRGRTVCMPGIDEIVKPDAIDDGGNDT
jgi:ABC-type ATPase with predicted acetyltransferase domain